MIIKRHFLIIILKGFSIQFKIIVDIDITLNSTFPKSLRDRFIKCIVALKKINIRVCAVASKIRAINVKLIKLFGIFAKQTAFALSIVNVFPIYLAMSL